jgi:uncharacterized protein involved in exopolysaccharide biosynthesis
MRYSTYERPLSLFDMIAAIFRYKWYVLLVTLFIFALSSATIFLFPKKFESEAKLFVRLGRGSASLDPSTMGQTISIQESRESEMNSIVDMLEGRGLAEEVVSIIGADRLNQKYAWAEIQAELYSEWIAEKLATWLPAEEIPVSQGTDADLAEMDDREQFELAVKELIKNLRIDSPKKSTTISIAYRARSPQLAQEVVTAVIECYEHMHIEAYQSGGVLEFFDEQFAAQEQLVSESEDSMRLTKTENSMLTLKGKQDSLQTEITDVKKMQLSAFADLDAAEARVAKLKSDMQSLPPEMLSQQTTGIAENATDAMRDRLYELEIQEKELSAKYVATHPELIRVREQLRTARGIVDQQPKEREQSVRAVNPVRLGIHNELLLAEAAVVSLRARCESLKELEAGLNERLMEINQLEVLSESLQRKVDIARENHKSYAKKLEESRINAALDQQSLSNVSIVSPPSIRFKHVSPQRSLLAVLAAMLSISAGIAFALLCDYSVHAKETKQVRDAEREYYLQQLRRETELIQQTLKPAQQLPPVRIGKEPVGSDAGEIDSDSNPKKAR